MTNAAAREIFNQAIARTTDADAIARIELAREEAWHICLGWPSESEVADAKARGMTAVPVTVRPDRS